MRSEMLPLHFKSHVRRMVNELPSEKFLVFWPVMRPDSSPMPISLSIVPSSLDRT